MNKRTPLYAEHEAAGAKLVPFAGWDMPIHYGSQVAEHEAVRGQCGVFDVSHMVIWDLAGSQALAFLQRLLANDAAALAVRGAQYGVMLNDHAGIVDDLITYRREQGYRLVTNAGTYAEVAPWLQQQQQAFDDVAIVERTDLAMLAVQGPQALEKYQAVSGVDASGIDNFSFLEQGDTLIARTGYTGEDGVEVMLPAAAAVDLWQALLKAGVAPAGLGARDTLRCEAGLNLYGQDMDDKVNPLASNLAWTIAWEPADRDFVGREPLSALREAGVTEKLTGIMLLDRGVIRHDYAVHTEAGAGVVTSGIHSPTLGYSVGLVRVPKAAKGAVSVEIRGKRVPAKLVKPPFVRQGRARHTRDV